MHVNQIFRNNCINYHPAIFPDNECFKFLMTKSFGIYESAFVTFNNDEFQYSRSSNRLFDVVTID